ncbi:aromatic compound dioxygenase [Stereum hirsutum FP-91666 SS1]|uniref:aromatic compound dioxygenase n=1 Tax=Stereum hirsutum (strain FP-91666) TaxID=721885 RepID=UPI0004449F92|nr:aromatic compound dioxygenase [Stereum hirsutum FP-91666 SS1]EIM85737.1 aromatic compound dioxygenase [Stereum hirsutum FP-91666 SS1]
MQNKLFFLSMIGMAAAGPTKRAYYNYLKNNTCLTAPEVAKDSTWLPNAPVTDDVVGSNGGVPMFVDVGIMDTTTCQAMTDVLVEIWSPNAVGDYESNSLRGAQLTDQNGIAEIQTIFPGFTSDGANHVNVIVHRPGVTSPEGVSTVAHVGQLFFTDKWTEVVSIDSGIAPYNGNTNTRTLNNNDPNFIQASTNAYYPVLDIEDIQDDWPAGVTAYITIGINPDAEYSLD